MGGSQHPGDDPEKRDNTPMTRIELIALLLLGVSRARLGRVGTCGYSYVTQHAVTRVLQYAAGAAGMESHGTHFQPTQACF